MIDRRSFLRAVGAGLVAAGLRLGLSPPVDAEPVREPESDFASGGGALDSFAAFLNDSPKGRAAFERLMAPTPSVSALDEPHP